MTFPVFGVSFKALEVGGGSAWRGGFTSQKGAVTSVGISQSCHLHPVPLCDGLPFMPLARPGSPSAGLANCSTWSPNASQGAEDLKYPVFVGDSLGRLVSGVHTH